MSALHCELVWRTTEGQRRQLRNFGSRRIAKSGSRVKTRSDSGAAKRELEYILQRMFESIRIVAEHAHIARPLFTKSDWSSVLHVGTADLNYVFPLVGFRSDGIAQGFQRRDQSLFCVDSSRNVHRRGKRIIGGLRHIDVVIGMNRSFAPQRRTGELAAAVGDHLIYVHVELRATPRHPHMQRKHVLMPTCKNLVAGLDDEVVPSFFEPPACVV